MWKATKTIALEQHMDSITVGLAAPAGDRQSCTATSLRRRRPCTSSLVDSMTGVHGCASATKRVRVAMGCIDN